MPSDKPVIMQEIKKYLKGKYYADHTKIDFDHPKIIFDRPIEKEQRSSVVEEQQQ